MSDKAHTRLLAALVLALALWWFLGGQRPEVREGRTFPAQLLQVDTAALTRFKLVPKPSTGSGPISFRRQGSQWIASQGEQSTPAFQRPIDQLFALLAHLQPVAMPGAGKSVVERYALDEGAAARFSSPEVLDGAELRVGSATKGPETPTQDPLPIATAVQIEGDPNVYLVEGDFGHVFNMTLLDWVPKPMVNGNPANWERITFFFPGGIGYALERTATGWLSNGEPANTEKVEKYLWAMSRYYGSLMVDPADTLNAVPVYSMRVEDKSRPEPIVFTVYQVGDHLIARSNLAPNWLVMPFDPELELPRMFRPPTAFL